MLLLLFSVGPLAVMALRADDVLVETFEESTLQSMDAIARAKTEAIDQFTEDRQTQVERIAQLVSPRVSTVLEAEAAAAAETGDGPVDGPPAQPEPLPLLEDAEVLQEDVPRSPRPPAETDDPDARTNPLPPPAEPGSALGDARDALRHTLGLILWDQQEFEELLVIDVEGRVVASTFEGHEGRTAAELDYFNAGLRTTYVQPVFVSPITERLTMVIATPMRSTRSELIGVLAARLNLSRLFRLINDRTGLGETGETVVAKLIDDEIVFMAPTRHDASAAFERRMPVDGAGGRRALHEATRGQDGADRITDYRGQCSYAAWEDVPSLGWGLVAKIDCDEALGPVHRARTAMMWLAALLVAIAVLAALIVAQGLVRPLRTLKNATDRISKGDFDVQLDIRSGDEIGELADSFERMVAAIKFFREHSSPEPDDSSEPPADEEEQEQEQEQEQEREREREQETGD